MMAAIMRSTIGTGRAPWTDGTYWADGTGWLEDVTFDAMFPAGGDGENVKFKSETTVKHGKLNRRN